MRRCGLAWVDVGEVMLWYLWKIEVRFLMVIMLYARVDWIVERCG